MAGIALIIGGGSGIGAASAMALAQEGWTCAVADLHLDAAGVVAGSLPGEGHRAFAVDAADESRIVALFEAVEQEAGAIGAVVVAAGTPGYIDGARPTIRSMPVDAWDSVMALNARGPMLCIREMLRRREAHPLPHGRIVLIGSMAAQTLAINSPASYVASKGAMMALARVAAGEAAQFGVTVNVVSPGAIDTPMLRGVMPKERDQAYFGATVAGRPGTAEEIAAAVAFLASPRSSYMNGACMDVNGGMLMR
ncbi:MAG: SDR family NAD(P)-dependent oxidoreductase [Sphingobium sp.]